MKPVFSKLLVMVLIITFISMVITSPTYAQSPEPPELLENGEYPLKIEQIEQALIERNEGTTNGGENGLTAAYTWWSASGTVFVPASSTITYNYGGSGCVDTGAVSDVWRGIVNLQHGSKITGMYLNYENDIENPADTTIYLRRYSYLGAYQDILSVTGTANTAGNHYLWTGTVANNIVNNLDYAYVLVWVGNPNQNLCGVNLRFEPPPIFLQALPMITR